jgi:DNA-binding NarL/FixJ family response regulator
VTIRVLVADDQPLVRSGFRMILDERPDLELVGEAEDGAQAVELAARLDPDVVLMDVRMPELDGVQATRQLVESGTRARILVLTTFDLDEYVYESIRAGASGFLLKDVQPEELVDSIRVVAAGNSLFGPTATRRLLEQFAQRPEPRSAGLATIENLTGREREILRLLASGHSNAEIAKELYLSETTVKSHVSAVLRKLGVRDRVQAVIAAYEAGLAMPGQAGSSSATT